MIKNPIAITMKMAFACMGSLLASFAHPDYFAVSNDVVNVVGAVVRTDDNGAVLDTFGEDVLFYPIALAFDRNGLLYVADYVTGAIQRFQADGTYIDEFANVHDTIGSLIFHPDGSLLVSRYEGGPVWRFDADGNSMGEFTNDTLTRHGQMAFDSAGNFYVSSWTDNTILQYDFLGNYLGVFADFNSAGLEGPVGIAFDMFGQMYVGEYINRNIKLLDGAGNYVTTVANTFGEIEFLTVDNDGSILVPYFFDNTIHRFDTAGNDLGEFASVLGTYHIEKGPLFVQPDSFTVQRGRVSSGNSSSLGAVDGDNLQVCRFFVVNATEPPVQVTVHGVSPVPNPSALTVHITSHMRTAGLFAQDLIMVDNDGVLSPARRTDSLNTNSKTVFLFADVPSNFVDGDGTVRVRYNVRPVGPVAAQIWCHEADQVSWTVVE